MKDTIFRDVTPYSLAEVYWHFDEWTAFIFWVKEYSKQVENSTDRRIQQHQFSLA
jgi:hypothetical protein